MNISRAVSRTRARLARAKELLRNTDLPISRVAAMIGYERSSSFSDFFRKHTGTSPRAYRATGMAGTRTGAAPRRPGVAKVVLPS